jgi:hypothetical protein
MDKASKMALAQMVLRKVFTSPKQNVVVGQLQVGDYLEEVSGIANFLPGVIVRVESAGFGRRLIQMADRKGITAATSDLCIITRVLR